MESKYHLVQLPCKKHIRKYIAATFGDPHNQYQIKATLRHPLGAMINASLTKEVYISRHPQQSLLEKGFTDKLPILINQWQFDNIGFDFPEDKVILINWFMEGLFDQHLFQWVDSGVNAGRKRKPCIEQFVSLHHIDIEHDVSFEALKKGEYRTRQRAEVARNPKALQHDLFS